MIPTMNETTPDAGADMIPTMTIAELEAAPHDALRRCRSRAPIVRRDNGTYVVLRAKDISSLLADNRLRASQTDAMKMIGVHDGALFNIFDYSMLTANGAVHRRRRAPFSRAFAVRMIETLRPSIRATANELIDQWPESGEVDFVDHFAAAVPSLLISEILGLPKQEIPSFTKLVYSVTRALNAAVKPGDLAAIEADSQALQDFVETLIAARRATPLDDLLSTFLADADQQDELSPIEIIMQIVILIIGGTDTTRVAMAAQVGLLLTHRAQWVAVCRDPSLIPAAVTEAMRYEPSVASTNRFTCEEIELDGHVLPADTLVALSTMSALRDEAVYSDPDRFDIHRRDHPKSHLIFGGGAHRCIGEAVAKAELEEGLAAVAARHPQLRLVDGMPEIRGHSGIRRIGTMRVRWKP